LQAEGHVIHCRDSAGASEGGGQGGLLPRRKFWPP